MTTTQGIGDSELQKGNHSHQEKRVHLNVLQKLTVLVYVQNFNVVPIGRYLPMCLCTTSNFGGLAPFTGPKYQSTAYTFSCIPGKTKLSKPNI